MVFAGSATPKITRTPPFLKRGTAFCIASVLPLVSMSISNLKFSQFATHSDTSSQDKALKPNSVMVCNTNRAQLFETKCTQKRSKLIFQSTLSRNRKRSSRFCSHEESSISSSRMLSSPDEEEKISLLFIIPPEIVRRRLYVIGQTLLC